MGGDSWRFHRCRHRTTRGEAKSCPRDVETNAKDEGCVRTPEIPSWKDRGSVGREVRGTRETSVDAVGEGKQRRRRTLKGGWVQDGMDDGGSSGRRRRETAI